MNEKNRPGVHIRERIIKVEELIAVDLVDGQHHNVYHNHAGAWELMYCTSGHMVMELDTDWIDMDAGCCMLVPPGTMHNSVTESDSTHCFFFAFVSGNDLTDISGRVIRLTPELTQLFDGLQAEVTTGYLNTSKKGATLTLIQNPDLPLGAEQLALNYLEMVLIMMLRNKSGKGVLPVSKTHVEYVNDFSTNYITDQVTEYIKEHLTEHLTVETIAEHFGYSRSRLSTLYKANTGTGINNAISYEKLLRARHLLIESDMSVAEISELLCYSSPQYFANKFTKSTGMSPSNYARFKRTKVN